MLEVPSQDITLAFTPYVVNISSAEDLMKFANEVNNNNNAWKYSEEDTALLMNTGLDREEYTEYLPWRIRRTSVHWV